MIRRRRYLLIPVYVALLVGGWFLGEWLRGLGGFEVRPINEPRLHAMIMMTASLYVLASAIPFVPGAEIGISMILLLGTPVVALVYACMVLALMIAYCTGRIVPVRATVSAFRYFGLNKAADLVSRMAPLKADERLVLLIESAPRRFAGFLLRHRYIALAVALNLPGNTLIGGGGGIAMVAGMSGLYPLPAFLLTVLIAVAPLPLFFLLMGQGS